MDFAENEGILVVYFLVFLRGGGLGDMCDMCFVPLSAMIMLLQILCQP